MRALALARALQHCLTSEILDYQMSRGSQAHGTGPARRQQDGGMAGRLIRNVRIRQTSGKTGLSSSSLKRSSFGVKQMWESLSHHRHTHLDRHLRPGQHEQTLPIPTSIKLSRETCFHEIDRFFLWVFFFSTGRCSCSPGYVAEALLQTILPPVSLELLV